MAATFFISNTPAQREALFTRLYQKAFAAAAKYVHKTGGNFDDAKDVFQDALVIYYEKLTDGNLNVNTSETAYLLGITRHLWLKRSHENNRMQPAHENILDISDEEETVPSEKRLLRYLETAGQKCMDILKAFYYDSLPLKDIATLFGYSSERSATVQKYRCLEKVRDTVKQKALIYEDFFE